ncbi:MAG: RNA methyltransferase, partial [Devosia sp.]
EGDRGTLLNVLTASPNRIAPFCPHFGACGGCQLQHLDRASYEAFKTDLVETPLHFAGIDIPVSRFIDGSGNGRRRATIHARQEGAGYMRLRSHQVHDLDACPILVPGLARAPDIARAVMLAVGEADIAFTATLTGLDVAVRAEKKQARADRLMPLVGRFKLARLALNGEMVLQAQPPVIEMGRARVELPIGSFLQATAAAETILADYVAEAAGKAKAMADLFCGIGPFALRLAETRPVYAADNDKPGILALDKARRFTKHLREITAKPRDLFREPLTRYELDAFDAVVLDPPRAGAQAQAEQLSMSKVKTIIMVACDPKSFARDAAILIGGGYAMENLVAVDQFVHSTHIEMAATFRR